MRPRATGRGPLPHKVSVTMPSTTSCTVSKFFAFCRSKVLHVSCICSAFVSHPKGRTLRGCRRRRRSGGSCMTESADFGRRRSTWSAPLHLGVRVDFHEKLRDIDALRDGSPPLPDPSGQTTQLFPAFDRDHSACHPGSPSPVWTMCTEVSPAKRWASVPPALPCPGRAAEDQKTASLKPCTVGIGDARSTYVIHQDYICTTS